MSNGSTVERELKFMPAPELDVADIDGLDDELTLEPAGTKHLRATYYDTADYRLARTGASLRFRDDDGWTVKLPSGVRRRARADGAPRRRRTRRAPRRRP